MQFFDGKRQSLAHLLKRLSHGLVPASQQHHAFAPSRGDIDQLQRMSVLACAAFAAMMHQIHLEMARFPDVPGNAFHRHSLRDLIGEAASWTRQARFP